MKKHVMSNLLFTTAFLVIFTPLCYFLYDYVISYGIPPTAAKTAFSKYDIPPIEVNRDFAEINEYADKVTVLMYHQIIPEDQLKQQHFTKNGELIDMVITLESFTEQMNFLKEQEFTVLSLKEFEFFMTHKKNVPDKSVLITFDDGYKNVFEFAYPVLKQKGFHAVHFIITGLITNRTAPFDPSHLQYASIDEMKKAADVFSYGNHTHSFHQRNAGGVAYLNAYEPTMVKENLAQANEWLGHSMAFAAPYGEYNPTTLEILKELEVRMGFTIDQGYAEPSQHILEIPRQGIYPFITIEDFQYILEQGARKESDRKLVPAGRDTGSGTLYH